MTRVGGGKVDFEARWAGSAAAGGVEALDGGWRVRRLSGPVPMPGVYKAARGGRGTTWARWSPFPALTFRLQQRGDSMVLIYDSPLSFLEDELRLQDDGSWLGRARVAGVQYAWFEMVPVEISLKEGS